ncbi:trihelix transcription factor GT-3a-like isoform X1 [Poecilia reticulata]|uniref:trihelix transcription factor GT-3a-like isoform X1 n=1 Tax=Poecilia reticulata TaxID=8081 RepID=UPI0004A25CB7|nr:PREDICTED: trihelix transcription factor GT-3a-like isoform X1 [Poecilia reticulata]
MARGQTWNEEEVKALLKIWADENVLKLLLTTHKNKQVFKLISGDMEALGFPRTASQCRTKVKKLRQQYVKIRNMLRNNGSTGDAKEQFPWYDELDAMLGNLPTSSQYVLESCKEEPLSPSSLELSDSESTEQDQDSDKRADKRAADIKAEETPITISLLDEERSRPKVTVPGAQKRKKNTKADKFEKMFESYLDEKRKMDEAESERMKREQASFEEFLKMQQQAEERRFQLMQEQQKASSKMFFQMMTSFLHAATPQSMTPSTLQQSMAPPPVTPPLWPSAHTLTDDSPLCNGHQQDTAGNPHTVLAPAQTSQEPNMATTSQHSASSDCGDANRDVLEFSS